MSEPLANHSCTSHRRFRARTRPALLAALAFGLVATACGDDPFLIRWEEDPDTALLYSLARPELNLISGFNFTQRIGVTIEDPTATGSWDLALDTRDGALVFLPPGVLGVTSRAGIAPLPDKDFSIRRAPTDTAAYVTDEPVPVSQGTLYVVRTHESIGGFGTRCVYYYKMVPLVVDAARGTVTFMYDGSPVCNDPKLVPPD